MAESSADDEAEADQIRPEAHPPHVAVEPGEHGPGAECTP